MTRDYLAQNSPNKFRKEHKTNKKFSISIYIVDLKKFKNKLLLKNNLAEFLREIHRKVKYLQLLAIYCIHESNFSSFLLLKEKKEKNRKKRISDSNIFTNAYLHTLKFDPSR